MKSSVSSLVLLVALVLFNVQICSATNLNSAAVRDDSVDAIQSMKNKVKRFKSFFDENPKFIDKQTFSDSSTGFVYQLTRINLNP